MSERKEAARAETTARLVAASRSRGYTLHTVAQILDRPSRTVRTWFNGTGCPTRPHAVAWADHLGIAIDPAAFIPAYRSTGCDSAIPILKQLFAKADRLGLSNNRLALGTRTTPSTIRYMREGRVYPTFATVEALADFLGFTVTLAPRASAALILSADDGQQSTKRAD